MKLTALWILAGVWAVVLAFVAWTYFREGLSPEADLLGRPKNLFTGIGALTVGLLPLYGTLQVHRYKKKRLRGRLIKERERIDRQLGRLDEQESLRAETPRSGATEA